MELTITKNVEDLDHLEAVIQRNLQSFYEMGHALMEIKAKELYKINNGGAYQTFEEYCRKLWDFTKTYANYLISATSVIENISAVTTMVVIPSTERQARALARLPADQQCEVWKKAIETAPDGKVTAAYVYKIVKGFDGAIEPSPHPEAIRTV